MGFNLAVDDSDGRGPGTDGTGELANDLELAYYWSQRKRLIGWNASEAEFYTAEEIAAGVHEDDFDLMLTPDGRLRQGAMGEIKFSDVIVVSCDPDSMGDLDGNGKVEFADFLILSGNFGQEVDGHQAGDIDCNGKVEFADFLTLSGNFGNDVGGAQSVPEPAGLAIASLAVMFAGALRRRRS